MQTVKRSLGCKMLIRDQGNGEEPGLELQWGPGKASDLATYQAWPGGRPATPQGPECAAEPHSHRPLHQGRSLGVPQTLTQAFGHKEFT